MDVSVYPGDDPDTEYEVSLHLAAIKLEISGAKAECSRRGLGQIAKWLAEISFAIRERPGPENLPQPELSHGNKIVVVLSILTRINVLKVLNWTHISSPSLTSQPFY